MSFSGLTLTPEFVVNAAGTALNTVLAAATAGSPVYIAAIIDPIDTQRIFNPYAEGNAVVAGTSTVAQFLPSLQASPVAVTVTDYLNQNAGFGAANSGAGVANIGQIKVRLVPGPSNIVEASSVLEFWLSPQAIILTASGTATL
jgi:hypothetical protein